MGVPGRDGAGEDGRGSSSGASSVDKVKLRLLLAR